MKTKKFEKRLVLNKKTIATINNGDLSIVKGGGVTAQTCTGSTCISCKDDTCPTDPCWSCECPALPHTN